MGAFECAKCGYDLTALAESRSDEVTCPECGLHGPPMEYQSYRSRARDFREAACFAPAQLAALALVLVIAGIGVSALEATRGASALEATRGAKGFFFGLGIMVGSLALLSAIILPFGHAATSRTDAQWRHDRHRIWWNLLLTLALNAATVLVAMVVALLLMAFMYAAFHAR